MIKATFWERLAAKIIDLFLFSAVKWALILAVIATKPGLSELVGNLLLLLAIFINFGVLHLAYNSYLTARFGGTVGKLLLGLEVLDENSKRLSLSRSVYRHTAGYLISGILFLGGYLFALRQVRNALHDNLTNSFVYRRSDGKALLGLLSIVVLVLTVTLETATAILLLVTNPRLPQDFRDLAAKLSPATTTSEPALSKSLVFEDQLITFDRMGSGTTTGTFWDTSPISEYGAKWKFIPENGVATDLRSEFSTTNFFYVQPIGMYFELEPGGYRTLKIVNADYIRGQIKTENSAYRQVSCQESDYPMGTIPTKAVACTTTLTNPQDPNQKDVSTITNCYIGLDNNNYGAVTQYLAYEQKIKPMGDVSTCDILTYMGIQGVYVN
jgi:uncharacterized RDD family membrane protein YckC